MPSSVHSRSHPRHCAAPRQEMHSCRKNTSPEVVRASPRAKPCRGIDVAKMLAICVAKSPDKIRCELARSVHLLPGGLSADDTGVSGPALAATSPPIRPFDPDVGSLHSQPGRCLRRGIL